MIEAKETFIIIVIRIYLSVTRMFKYLLAGFPFGRCLYARKRNIKRICLHIALINYLNKSQFQIAIPLLGRVFDKCGPVIWTIDIRTAMNHSVYGKLCKVISSGIE